MSNISSIINIDKKIFLETYGCRWVHYYTTLVDFLGRIYE